MICCGAHNITLVDAQRDAHQHLLRPLRHHTVEAQQVRLLKRLVTEEVIFEVAVVAGRR